MNAISEFIVEHIHRFTDWIVRRKERQLIKQLWYKVTTQYGWTPESMWWDDDNIMHVVWTTKEGNIISGTIGISDVRSAIERGNE